MVTTRTEGTLLPDQAVHVWRFSLITSRQETLALGHWLSKRENEALDRMGSHLERAKRIAAWGRLRHVLSRYLICPPEDIELEREPLCRPEIVHPENRGLRFSLAHSGSFGLVGVATEVLGVDIERIQPSRDVERLATRFFSADEIEALRNLPKADRMLQFYRLWVLKEAYLKAVGEGVPSGLSKCAIEFKSDEPRLLSSDVEVQSSKHTLVEIPASKGYVAALFVLQHDISVSVFDL